jgi:tripartite-type tricarboxylate transporter receptor subunit TctC
LPRPLTDFLFNSGEKKLKSYFPFYAVWIAIISFVYPTVVGAQDYYQDKTVRIVVGLSSGGGFDVYARTMARHLGKR